ncbi:MAG TPA: GntR family transcriptional regulator [Streptosporangiaceae bacterium]|nr:GntR family transcriptional regulator [Streptosporangiaceae bacterium]
MGTATHPVYLRVLDDLRAQIRDGVLGPGERVPSRNGVMARYGVGETAAKHALAVLAAEGLIETRAGSGSYVRGTPPVGHLEHDRPHFSGSPYGLREARPHGEGHGERGNGAAPSPVVSWEHQTGQARPPRHIARRLGLADGETVIRTRYLLTADGCPVQLALSYEPSRLTAHTVVSLPEEGPYAGRGVVERMRAIGIAVDHVEEDISARACSGGEAPALHLSPGATVLVVSRMHLAAGKVVEVSEITVPAERFRLRYSLPVPAGVTVPGHSGPKDPQVAQCEGVPV